MPPFSVAGLGQPPAARDAQRHPQEERSQLGARVQMQRSTHRPITNFKRVAGLGHLHLEQRGAA